MRERQGPRMLPVVLNFGCSYKDRELRRGTCVGVDRCEFSLRQVVRCPRERVQHTIVNVGLEWEVRSV